MSYKKYYQMAAVGFAAIMVYWLFKKNPAQAHKMIASSNEYIKYLPVDRNTTSMLSPILDFTSKYSEINTPSPILNLAQTPQPASIDRPDSITGVGKATKRSVSETKKKWVAASQGWTCGKCNRQLPAWYEVDHKIRLEYGGSNHVDNLVALCRDCHGQKTAIENL